MAISRGGLWAAGLVGVVVGALMSFLLIWKQTADPDILTIQITNGCPVGLTVAYQNPKQGDACPVNANAAVDNYCAPGDRQFRWVIARTGEGKYALNMDFKGEDPIKKSGFFQSQDCPEKSGKEQLASSRDELRCTTWNYSSERDFPYRVALATPGDNPECGHIEPHIIIRPL